MNELIRKAMEKAGITADRSKTAVETAPEFIEGKWPPGILDSVPGGKAAGGGDGTAGGTNASDVLGKTGGMFGKG